MSTVNILAREIAAKVVFYGPGLSGKTTSLKRIYDSVRPSLRGELLSLPTESDRTLFFDFLPVRVERVAEYALRLALYTVPGQVFYNATRKLVLQGADGVIFVADSNPDADDANRESLANLEENLAEQGMRLDHFPLVIAFNKRDLPNAVPTERLRASLNPRGVPDFETVATSGEGVLDAMKALIRLVILDLRARKVVPSPKAVAPIGPALKKDGGLESEIRAHLLSEPPEERKGPTLGPVAALAPSVLVDSARVADACFASRDWDGCVRACQDTVRRALGYAGEGGLGGQAALLGVDGRDVLKLMKHRDRPRIVDASFGLYVLMQTFVRLDEAGLPSPSQ